MLPESVAAAVGSAAEAGCQAALLTIKRSVPKCRNYPRISPPPMTGDDPAWIITPAHACPTVGANCHGDFAAIHMILGYCGGKAHVEDLGMESHTVQVLPRFGLPVLGATPYSC
jgi:hypothetical protein